MNHNPPKGYQHIDKKVINQVVSSKKELYQVVRYEMHKWLPSLEVTSLDWLHQIITKKRKVRPSECDPLRIRSSTRPKTSK